MVSKIVDNPSQQVQGLYKDSMNKGTSQVNWDDITTNQQKIAEYKKRMLGQKQELGHMNREKGERSVKSHSYVPYSNQIYGQGYQGNTIDAKDNKAKDQRVQVTLNQVTINKTVGLEGQTEFR